MSQSESALSGNNLTLTDNTSRMNLSNDLPILENPTSIEQSETGGKMKQLKNHRKSNDKESSYSSSTKKSETDRVR